MPKMDGTEATRYIKQRLPNVKVPVLTMHTGYIDEAQAASNREFIVTPEVAKNTNRKRPFLA